MGYHSFCLRLSEMTMIKLVRWYCDKVRWHWDNVRWYCDKARWYNNKARRKEGNVIFNDALNTFYLRLYGVRHMIKDHSDSERVILYPTDRIIHTTTFVTPVMEHLYVLSCLWDGAYKRTLAVNR